MMLTQRLDLQSDRLTNVLHAYVPLVRELLEFLAVVLFDLLALILMLRLQVAFYSLLSVVTDLVDVLELSLRLIV